MGKTIILCAAREKLFTCSYTTFWANDNGKKKLLVVAAIL